MKSLLEQLKEYKDYLEKELGLTNKHIGIAETIKPEDGGQDTTGNSGGDRPPVPPPVG